ncbi:hypothetical protein ACIOHE_15755 [Streptomyces sp. NPDC087851]|uniref:hypothetical protein n=1 Tax=Streptomyces sp. NPDC087851 TaxID=3365810 RepID=UPI0037F4C89E
MSADQLIAWALAHRQTAATAALAALLLAAALLWLTIRTVRSMNLTTPVVVAALGAAVCTAYSGDTSWRFAETNLKMTDTTERAVMFGAGELALLACAVMARANKRATATATAAGTPGVPGVLVWVITGVQIIPCYATSGFVGGTVRAVIGPVMAGLLWHLAMGLEIRVVRPEALSTGLPAVIGRELRERFLSCMGLATRDRTAEQITRDRATARAVHLAAVLEARPTGWGANRRRRRLAAAVARSGAGTDGVQRHRLLQDLAARRTSGQLATVPVTSPWTVERVPEPHPTTLLGITGAQLRAMDPMDAVLRVHAAHPAMAPAELAALCTEYGVPVSEAMVGVALRAARPAPVLGPVPAVPARPILAAAPLDVLAVPAAPRGPGLLLDLDLADEVHPDVVTRTPVLASQERRTQVHARVPSTPDTVTSGTAAATAHAPVPAVPAPEVRDAPSRTHEVQHPAAAPEHAPAVPGPPVPGASTAGADPLLDRARALDAEHLRTHRRPASIRALKTGLRVGQTAAQQVRAALDEESHRS